MGCRHTDGQDLGGDSTPGPGSSSGVRGFLQVCVCVCPIFILPMVTGFCGSLFPRSDP